MHRRVWAAVAAVTATSLLTACGAAAVEDWVQGTWTCDSTHAYSEGDEFTQKYVVTVSDGKWTAKPIGEDLQFGVTEQTSGTWSISPAGLQVNATYGGSTGGLIPGLPETTADLNVLLSNVVWNDEEPGGLSVSATEEAVTLTHVDVYTAAQTVTVCSKN